VVALLSSGGIQIAAQRFAGARRRDQAIGLALVAAGLGGVVVAAPLASLPLLAAGAATAGAGHGLAFINAQQELDEIAPADRGGEVPSAFIACIYAMVAGSVIATGVLDRRLSLTLSVAVAAVVLVLIALAAAAWQTGMPRRLSAWSRSRSRLASRPVSR